MSDYESLFVTLTSTGNFAHKVAGETDQQFLRRMCEGAGALPDDKWLILTEGARKWFENCLTADDAIKDTLSLPEGYPQEAATPVRRRPVVTEPVETPVETPVHSGSNGSGEHKYVDADGRPLSSIEVFNAKLASGEVKRRPRGGVKEDKEAAPAQAKPKEKQRRNRKPSLHSATSAIRVELTNDPSLSAEQLHERLKGKGFEVAPQTVASTRAAHLASMLVMQELGWAPTACN